MEGMETAERQFIIYNFGRINFLLFKIIIRI